jgi:geranylgeranylglycerol-phosphate geranylgeranyltransferase
MKGYPELLRPLNCLMVAIAVFIGGLIGVGLSIFEEAYLINILLAGTVAFLFTGAGNALNDYYDRVIDRINHPERPIPSGEATALGTRNFALFLFVVSLILSFLINLLSLLIVSINLVIMISYEVFSKAKGVAGNATISWLTATTFLFGGAAVDAIMAPLILAALAFLATFGREIAKDIEDVKGDIGRITLPKTIGIRDAGVIASLSIVAALLLSPVPYFIDLFGGNNSFYYLIIVILADIIFIYSIGLILKRAEKTSGVIKYGMFVALLAFLMGGFGLF